MTFVTAKVDIVGSASKSGKTVRDTLSSLPEIGFPQKNAVLTISVPNSKTRKNGTFKKHIRSSEQKIHIMGESLYWLYDYRPIMQNDIAYSSRIAR